MLRAFISYPYRPELQALVNVIIHFLHELEIETIDGKWPDATIHLRDDIISKIKSCDLLISITFAGIPSSWVEQEIGFALGWELDVIQITDGTEPRPGMLSGHFQISCSKSDGSWLTELLTTINKIKQKRYTPCGPTLSANAPVEEYENEAWPVEILEVLGQLRCLFAKSQFELCLATAKHGVQIYPHCWRFLIAQSAALTHLNKLDEAEALANRVIQDYANEPRVLSYAFDNKGWILERRPGGATNKNLKYRLTLHRRALQSERRVETYIALIVCLLQLDRIRAADHEFQDLLNRFPGSIHTFRERVRLKGKEYVQAIAKSDLICSLLFPLKEVAA